MSRGTRPEKERTKSYPLSALQQGLLFHTMSPPGPGVDVVQVIGSLHEELDAAAFAQSWQRVVDRHPILRSGFYTQRGAGEPSQEVHSGVEILVQQQDWRGVPQVEQEARLEAWLQADAARVFELSQPPLMRLELFQLGAAEYQFVWTFHHLLLDGRAIHLVLNEVFALYETFRRHEPLKLPDPVPYRKYIDWLAQQDFSRAESFWRRTLKGFAAPTLPRVGRLAPSEMEAGDFHGRQELRLTKEVTGTLRSLATEHHLTLSTILQGAWALLLSRYSGEEDVLFGTVRACRHATVTGAESIVGPFINTVPLRVWVDPQRPLLPWLAELRASGIALRPWEHTPLVKIQGWSELPGKQSLFETIFNFQDPSWETLLPRQGWMWSRRQFSIRNHSSYPLAIDACGGDDLLIRLLFHRHRFDDATIGRMLGHLKTLLEGIAANAQRRLYELPMLTAAERHQLLVEWNDTGADFPKGKCVHQLFEEQVGRTPEALAVRDANGQLTYGELHRKASRLAARLERQGVGPDVRVAVCLERSVDFVVAILGVLKAGGAYVPLDPASPRERLEFMIDNAQAPVLITDDRLRETFLVPANPASPTLVEPLNSSTRFTPLVLESGTIPVPVDMPRAAALGGGSRFPAGEEHAGETLGVLSTHFSASFKRFPFEIICVEDKENASENPLASSPAPFRAVQPGNLAYVIYTSGSTGTPKGVEIEHSSLINLIAWHRRAYQLTPADRAAQVAAPAFDASVWEIWPYLAVGASLHIPGEATRSSPAKLKTWLAANEITVCFIPTPLAESMFEGPWPACPALRAVLTGGDKLNRPPPPEFPCALINHYGPTENTVVTTCTPIPPAAPSNSVPPIGRPIHNTQVYVLDRQLQPVPIGVPGELHISGAGLARGYLGAPELTARKFVANPFSQDRSARLYKTGDSVRWLSDGRIEFIGRVDQQVKIRGNRIELGEIEFALNQHSAVRQAAVVARESEGGEKRLVAYVVNEPELPGPPPDRSSDEPHLLVKGREQFSIDGLLFGSPNSLLSLGETATRPGEVRLPVPGADHANLGGVRQPILGNGEKTSDSRAAAEVPVTRGEEGDTLCLPSAGSALTTSRRLTEAELRDHLKRTLPEWMIPTAFVFVNALPRTTNGKVDRKALPAPVLDPVCPPVPPRTATEETLVRIWREVLGVKGLGTNQDFFRMGGHSLLATQVISRVWDKFHVELPLQSLFEAPTILGLAEKIDKALGEAAASMASHSATRPRSDKTNPTSMGSGLLATVGKTGAPFPRVTQDGESFLSFAQERLWFLEQMEPGIAFNNIPFAFRLQGALNLAALEQALDEMVRRHDTFRTVIQKRNGKPVALAEPARAFTLLVFDLSALSKAEREAEATRLVTETARRPFDLSRSPLLRAKLIRLSTQEHWLVLVTHHVACDGWSLGVFHRELSLLYTAFAEELPSALPAPEFKFADFSNWQRQWLRGPILDEQLRYWKQQLDGAPAALEVPADRPRPPIQTYSGAVRHFTLPAELSESLVQLSQKEGVTLFMLLLAAFQTLLHRYSGQEDVLVGSPIAGRTRVETENLIGVFLNMLVLRGDLSGDPTFRELLKRVRKTALEAYGHQDVPFEKLVDALQPQRDLSRSPLIQVMFVLHNQPVHPLELVGLSVEPVTLHNGTAKFDLTLSLEDNGQGLNGFFEYNTDLFSEQTLVRMLGHFEELLKGVVANVEQRLSALPLLTDAERDRLLADWNNTGAEFPQDKCIHDCFSEQVERTPRAIAVVFEDQQLTYRELDERASQLAGELRALGVGPEVRVGLCVERSLEMMVGLLGILKAGGCYVPLDPAYPMERLTFMLEDSQVPVLLTQQKLQASLHFEVLNPKVLCLDAPRFRLSSAQQSLPSGTRATADNLAYVIYTSGSTGKPKGVMVTHRNVLNFFGAMDRMLGVDPGVWLAVSSVSFDISVLELFWTLSRGFKVVIQGNHDVASSTRAPRKSAGRSTEYSLFYFASDASHLAQDSYRLLLEGAKFADRNGFAAVWTPERHFHAFGGLYPNPSVTSAALAMITDRVQIRAGSVVLPLHHPLRVAEEWAVVDNLSKGRVAISFASGWNANDFALAPEQYADRHEILGRGIEMVRKLWRGETMKVKNGAGAEVEVSILPRPVQPELPFWITAAGNPETFRKAGEMGANLLTHLLGQTVEELAQKIALYRSAWKNNGHPGEGQVTLMLHTFVGPDLESVRNQVRGPFSNYLRTSVDLIRKACLTETSSAFGPRSRGAAKPSTAAPLAPNALNEDDMDAMVAHAFNRYFQSSGLFGTPEVCLERIEQVKAAGVNEVACLIDFGVDAEAVLNSLTLLQEVKERSNQHSRPPARSRESFAIAEQMIRHGVTHLQCTPSLATMLVQNPDACQALASLKKLLLGGEALPPSLATQLQQVVPSELINMYGPTETTVWSTAYSVGNVNGPVPIGRPLANTEIYIVDRNSRPVPVGVPGELLIGGAGVARGYQNRPELTVERFIPHPFSSEPQARLYRTGDLARYHADGCLEFIGRMDQQVKIRGHRIELGEIEATLTQHPAVRECVGAVIEESLTEKRLAFYVVLNPSQRATSVNELRAFLHSKLPDYMIPSAFVILEALPLTPNGKLNRLALPPPVLKRAETGTFAGPSTPTEQALARIWCEVLGLPKVGVNENFFELGGHSLLIMQVISRVRESFEIDLPMRRFFEAPVIAGLASTIQALLVDKIYDLPEEEANRLAIGQATS
jgi:natural product biosynthesis luciferase-like monooxygenase protein/amino acid adenylation domain-containing protein